MATTSNLNLPLIPDNAVNNVKRDMNALAEAVDTAVTEKVNEANSVAEAAQTTANAANLAAAAAQTKADQAFQLGNERKAEVVAALVAKGISASTSDSWDSLISKMTAIVKATGNATAAQVRAGATFSNESANGLIGTLAVRATAAQTVMPGTSDVVKAAGIYDGPITVKGDPNLLAQYIKRGIPLFNVFGTLEPKNMYSVYMGNGTGITPWPINLSFDPQIIYVITSTTDPTANPNRVYAFANVPPDYPFQGGVKWINSGYGFLKQQGTLINVPTNEPLPRNFDFTTNSYSGIYYCYLVALG